MHFTVLYQSVLHLSLIFSAIFDIRDSEDISSLPLYISGSGEAEFIKGKYI